MLKQSFYLFIFLFLTFSCKSSSVNDSNIDEEGRVSIRFEKVTIPRGVATITATLTRTNYQTLSSQIFTSGNSPAEISFDKVVPGVWHLKVDAADENGTVLYSGETNVTVAANNITQASVTLQPTGSLIISVNWQKEYFIDNPYNPVFTNSNSPQHPAAGVGSCFILNINGKYKMWYSGWYGNSKYDVQYAESLDGISWQSITNQPVIAPGQFGSYTSHAVYGGPVIYENGKYTMYFTAIPFQSGDTYIGMATSSDGINWGNAIIPIIQENGKRYAVNAVIKKGNQYLLYYSYTNSLINDWGISLATSSDGINWSTYGEKIMPLTQNWESPGLHFPSIIYYQNEYKMIYGSISSDGFGLATSSDGFNWTKSNDNPIATPAMTTNSWVSDLRYPNLIIVDNELRLYYSGMHNGIIQIGYAKLNL